MWIIPAPLLDAQIMKRQAKIINNIFKKIKFVMKSAKGPELVFIEMLVKERTNGRLERRAQIQIKE